MLSVGYYFKTDNKGSYEFSLGLWDISINVLPL